MNYNGMGTGAVLPATGMMFGFWWMVAAVALVGVGAILIRLAPKKES